MDITSLDKQMQDNDNIVAKTTIQRPKIKVSMIYASHGKIYEHDCKSKLLLTKIDILAKIQAWWQEAMQQKKVCT